MNKYFQLGTIFAALTGVLASTGATFFSLSLNSLFLQNENMRLATELYKQNFSEAAKTILNASADISLITKQNSALGYFLLLSMSFFMTISVVSVIFGFLKEKNNKEEYVK